MKKAIVTGIRGQDGAYLSKLLIEEGYKVIGADRRSGDSTYWRLRELGILDEIELVDMDLLDRLNVFRVINEIQPDEIYNLAAQSFVGASFNQPIITTEINANSVLFLLETIRTVNPRIKFYQASTSEMFGKVQEIPQTEKTPFYPRSPYAVAKLFAHWAVVNYRESYNLFAASGILFNHESPLRGEQFVTRKITLGLARIKSGKQDKLLLGNLEAKRDWGHAKEYVRGMWSMLQNDIPDTFVLATGVTHSVKEFVDAAAAAIDMDIVWEGAGIDAKGINKKTGKIIIEVSKDFFRPAEVDILQGNAIKASNELQWAPTIKFNQLAEEMAVKDMARVTNYHD